MQYFFRTFIECNQTEEKTKPTKRNDQKTNIKIFLGNFNTTTIADKNVRCEFGYTKTVKNHASNVSDVFDGYYCWVIIERNLSCHLSSINAIFPKTLPS